jgi:hypothetical protein
MISDKDFDYLTAVVRDVAGRTGEDCGHECKGISQIGPMLS